MKLIEKLDLKTDSTALENVVRAILMARKEELDQAYTIIFDPQAIAFICIGESDQITIPLRELEYWLIKHRY